MGSIVGSIVGSVVSSLISGAMGGDREEAKPVAPPKPPQAAKSPDTVMLRQNNMTAALPGGSPTSTLLTGPSGIEDDELKLGKNTLLGG